MNKRRYGKMKIIGLSVVMALSMVTAFVTPISAATKLGDPGSGGGAGTGMVSPMDAMGVRGVMGTGKYTTDVDNGIYYVSVQDVAGRWGEGTYTIATGSGHPVPNRNVLYGGADHDPGSTYLTVRVYDAGREYVSTTGGPAPSAGYIVTALDGCSPATTGAGNEVHTTWTTDEGLLICQAIAVAGTTPDDSMVRVTTTVTNNDAVTHRVGIRYLWDLMIDEEDGSWFAERYHSYHTSDWIETECEWASPTFRRYNATNDPNSSIFTIVGTSRGIGKLSPEPTAPDLLQFAAWGSSGDGVFDHAFDYTPTGQTLAGAGADSAIAYYWGNTEANAMELAPGGSVSVTQYLQAIPPPPRDIPILTHLGVLVLVGLLALIGAGAIVKEREG